MAAKCARVLPALVACAALLALPGCIAVRSDQVPSWVPSSLVPTAPPTAAAKHPAVKDQKRTDVWLAYFAKKGRLVGGSREGKPADTSPERALQGLLAGPSSAEKKLGYTTDIPAGTVVRSVTMDYASAAHLDLSREFAEGASTKRMSMRVAQIVYTLTQLPGINGVLIKIDGRPVQDFGSEKLDLMAPQTRKDFPKLAPLP